MKDPELGGTRGMFFRRFGPFFFFFFRFLGLDFCVCVCMCVLRAFGDVLIEG
jgi:hypothetical protein